MPKEEFYEPTKKEVDEAVASAGEQMREFNKSRPTKENVNEAMKSVAEQFGEKFEAGDPAVPEQDIIGKYKREGWDLVDIITNAAKVSINQKEGKEIKIVGLGEKFLVFEKEKEEQEEE